MRFRPSAVRTARLATVATLFASTLAAQGAKPLPLKYVGPPTVPEITAGDLMTRLYKFADDSMMGRDVGSVYHLKAAAYLEGELRRMGLKPGGPNGSFYQDFPLWKVSQDKSAAIVAGGTTIPAGKDFTTMPGAPVAWNNIPMIYFGSPLDTSVVFDSAAAAGKIIVGATFPQGMTPEAMNAFRASAAYKAYVAAQRGAVGRVLIVGDVLPPELMDLALNATPVLEEPQLGNAIQPVYVSSAAIATVYGTPVANIRRNGVSAPVTVRGSFAVSKSAEPGRNVVAILPGSDPVLKNQYVAIGAHNDHVGYGHLGGAPAEHDSLKIWNTFGIPAGAEGGRNLIANPITAAEWGTINGEIAALRKIYPPRQDSIRNGADDDGSGSVSVLEIAEAFAKGTVKPKRSILFVWHAGEEHGMWGSGYFMDHPTVPRDSIVAQINIDMVGRGAATDITGQAKGPVDAQGNVTGPGAELRGGDRYVQLVGSRRLSTQLGDLVEQVNTEKKHGFRLDYSIDADGHQQNIYCRSDHWSYGKWGIPVVFFTTGGHADYHQVTDEPQYIRYDHMAALNKLIFDITAGVANLAQRPVVDKPKPNPVPATECRQ